jgi:hypothetical protein
MASCAKARAGARVMTRAAASAANGFMMAIPVQWFGQFLVGFEAYERQKSIT